MLSKKNEAEKIKIYKINDKIITDKDIIDCTHEHIDINIFKFIDNIINKNLQGESKDIKEERINDNKVDDEGKPIHNYPYECQYMYRQYSWLFQLF